MPLDMSLNNDIQLSLPLHYTITDHLDKDNERKFSMATPKMIAKGIQQLSGHDGNVPSSRRIMQDCDLALHAFRVVYRAGGKMIPGLANQSGHRNHTEGRNKEGLYGVRVKNVLREEVRRWLHLHTQEANAERTAELIESLDI